MPSTISWLDQSADEQRRVRELVGLFSESESRDELGIGQVRDVFSNRLFPGTSVIQTRTRYFLFIPWLFQVHQAKGRTGADLLRRVQESERQLIATMLAADHKEGLIGRDAGTRVKTLPTAIYWNGLQRFGVLRQGISPDGIGPSNGPADLDPGQDERSERADSIWQLSLPPVPAGFPQEIPDGFDLTIDEATWFRDLTLRSSPDTLLAHLMASAEPLDPDSEAPWLDSVAQDAPAEITDLLEDARRFSLVMHGAALLYNLLLAEAYEHAGYDAVLDGPDRYRALLEDWSLTIAEEEDDLRAWQFDPWWDEVVAHNHRIGSRTRDFIAAWLEVTRSLGGTGVAGDGAARLLIKNRERFTKGRQARLGNDRLLKAWNGASGTRLLVYRWGTVHRLVTDVLDGLGNTDAGA